MKQLLQKSTGEGGKKHHKAMVVKLGESFAANFNQQSTSKLGDGTRASSMSITVKRRIVDGFCVDL